MIGSGDDHGAAPRTAVSFEASLITLIAVYADVSRLLNSIL